MSLGRQHRFLGAPLLGVLNLARGHVPCRAVRRRGSARSLGASPRAVSRPRARDAPPPGSARDARALGGARTGGPKVPTKVCPAKRPRVSRPEPSERATSRRVESSPARQACSWRAYRGGDSGSDEAARRGSLPSRDPRGSERRRPVRDDSSVGPRGDSSDDATCPSCGSLLRDAADTAIARAPHVNAAWTRSRRTRAGHSRAVPRRADWALASLLRGRMARRRRVGARRLGAAGVRRNRQSATASPSPASRKSATPTSSRWASPPRARASGRAAVEARRR